MHATVLFMLAFAICAHAAKILIVFPGFAHSHYTIGYSLAKELAKRGHEVTFVSPHAEKKAVKNVRNVELVGIQNQMKEMMKDVNMFDFVDLNPFISTIFIGNMGLMLADETLKDEAMQKLLKSDESFDLVISENFMCDAIQGIANHYNVPSVVLSAIGPTILTNHIVGAPDIPSFMPHMSLEFKEDTMPFCGRVYNTVLYLYQKLYDHLYFYPKHNQILQTYFPGAPNIYDVIYNTSLVLVNSHVSYGKALPIMPNMIEIGGYHVDPPQKLPEDLQKIIGGSKDGVIYFSMGSNLKSAHLRPELKDAILKVFSKLKQTVLWKFEEDLPNKPSNVIIRSWFPQNDVLAHPNVILFITHGGLLSTIETIYHGKPVIGIPIFGDQAMNIATAVNAGYGLEIRFDQLSETTFSETVNEALTNPKYTQIAKLRSKIMHDQEVKPRDRAVYWVDYVLRHKGAPHLKSPGLQLKPYQYYMVDVILFLTVITVVKLAVFYLIVKWILGKKKSPKITKKKTKQT